MAATTTPSPIVCPTVIKLVFSFTKFPSNLNSPLNFNRHREEERLTIVPFGGRLGFTPDYLEIPISGDIRGATYYIGINTPVGVTYKTETWPPTIRPAGPRFDEDSSGGPRLDTSHTNPRWLFGWGSNEVTLIGTRTTHIYDPGSKSTNRFPTSVYSFIEKEEWAGTVTATSYAVRNNTIVDPIILAENVAWGWVDLSPHGLGGRQVMAPFIIQDAYRCTEIITTTTTTTQTTTRTTPLPTTTTAPPIQTTTRTTTPSPTTRSPRIICVNVGACSYLNF